MVYVDGVYQRKSTYTWVGTTLTFSSAPALYTYIEISIISSINSALSTSDLTLTGNLAVNGGVITSTNTTANVFQATTTTLNIGGAATTIKIGASTGTTTYNSTTASTSTSTGAVVNLGGEGIAGNLNVGGTTSTFAGNVGIGTSTTTGLSAGSAITVWGNVNVVSPSAAFLVNSVPIGVGGTIVNDTGSNASTFYPTMANNLTSGSFSNVVVSNSKLYFNPSTGTLTATNMVANAVTATSGMFLNSNAIVTNYTVASGTNALSVGPITINSGVTVTISNGQRWVIL
jgi:hypothetical protein